MKKPHVLFRKTKKTAILVLLTILFLLCAFRLYAMQGESVQTMANGEEYTPQSMFGLLVRYAEG